MKRKARARATWPELEQLNIDFPEINIPDTLGVELEPLNVELPPFTILDTLSVDLPEMTFPDLGGIQVEPLQLSFPDFGSALNEAGTLAARQQSSKSSRGHAHREAVTRRP